MGAGARRSEPRLGALAAQRQLHNSRDSVCVRTKALLEPLGGLLSFFKMFRKLHWKALVKVTAGKTSKPKGVLHVATKALCGSWSRAVSKYVFK